MLLLCCCCCRVNARCRLTASRPVRTAGRSPRPADERRRSPRSDSQAGAVAPPGGRRPCAPEAITKRLVPSVVGLIQSKSPPPSQPFGVCGATSASVGRMAKRRCGKLPGPGPEYFPLLGFALRLLVSETGIFQYTWVFLHTRVLVTVWRCLRHRMSRAHGNWLCFQRPELKRPLFIYVKSTYDFTGCQ